MKTFNYLVTVHNSEAHLSHVLSNLFACIGSNSKVFIVLDGCTDRSKMIAESYDATIIETPDIRETLAINAALKQMPAADYTFILQDDVIVQDMDIEEKILKAYDKFGDIGVLSLRHGSNFKPDTLENGLAVSEMDVIQSEHQPYLPNTKLLEDGHLIFKHIVYKSPIVLSSHILLKLGGYDERFAPIAHDDTEYCVRAQKAGFRNAVLSVPIIQPLELGGTRRHTNQPRDYHEEHMNLIRKLYPDELKHLQNNHPSLEQIKIC